jgi:hypothetical protein
MGRWAEIGQLRRERTSMRRFGACIFTSCPRQRYDRPPLMRSPYLYAHFPSLLLLLLMPHDTKDEATFAANSNCDLPALCYFRLFFFDCICRKRPTKESGVFVSAECILSVSTLYSRSTQLSIIVCPPLPRDHFYRVRGASPNG